MLVGVVIGVTVSLLGFRLFAPNEAFPVTYRRGRAAHLDVGVPAARPSARRCGTSSGWRSRTSNRSGWPVRPGRRRCASSSPAIRVGGCSASSTPAPTCGPTAGTSSGASCCMAGWRTRSPSTRCDGWCSRRTTCCTRCRGRAAHAATLWIRGAHPEREYLLVTEFFDGAVELGQADVDDRSSTTASP